MYPSGMTNPMRPIATALCTLALLGATSTLAGATDKEKFDSLIEKYATSGLGMPTKLTVKGACYCTPGSVAPTGAAGYLVNYPVGAYTYVNCYVPLFNADGSLQGTQYCNNFAVLSK